MSTPTTTLTGDDSIKTWLAHPVGGPILRDLLAQSGQDADVLKPVSRLAIKRLIKLSKGQFSQQMVDELVARVATGEVPRAPPLRHPRPSWSAPSGSSASTRAASPARP